MGKSKETEENQKTGRPLTEIDWEKVDGMCGVRCTGEEIAGCWVLVIAHWLER